MSMKNAECSFQKPLELALEKSIAHLASLDQSSVAATADLITLRSRLAKPLAPSGLAPQQVIEELVRDVEGGLLGSAGGRFFGWVIGGSLPSALAADWLTSAWEQNGSMYATGPAAAVAEEVAGCWLKEILHIPPGASFALVTGCQMAHTTCLAAARHGVLDRAGWDVERDGLFGAPRIRILSSDQRHGTFERALRFLGLGLANAEYIEADSHGRLEAGALEDSLRRNPSAPTIVLLQAGDVNIGAYDPFAELIPVAKKYGAWVHIDGAFGLWAAASRKFAHLVRGAEAADSWATDGHKWLNVPFDCGYAFVADPDSHRASMAHRAAYITHSDDARDAMDWNPEWSRRARGFATYAALRELGCEGVSQLVERCCRHASSIVKGIEELPGTEVLFHPVINQGLVRFLDRKPGATEAAHDRRTDEVITAILKTGEAFFGGTTWRGKRAMRISVSNWRTTEDEVNRTVRAISRVLKT